MSARYLHTIRADCPLPAGTPVVGYARDSGADAQERSVDQQIEAIREYCVAHGLALEHVYADRARPGSAGASMPKGHRIFLRRAG